MTHERALGPHARALVAYHMGRTDAVLHLKSDLGEDDDLPVEVFFRSELFPFEVGAIEACRGRVLDLGAAVGIHSLILQNRGFDVTAVEIVPEVAAIARERGVTDVRVGDFFELDLEPADTVLLLMNGPGPCGTIDGFERLLRRLEALVNPGGQVIFDSGPPQLADDPAPLAGITPARDLGRYPGEAWIQLTFDGESGEPFQELYIDSDTARTMAEDTGWDFMQMHEDESGNYTARLTRLDEPRVVPGS